MNFDARLRLTVVKSMAKFGVCDGACHASLGHYLMVVSNCDDMEASCDTCITRERVLSGQNHISRRKYFGGPVQKIMVLVLWTIINWNHQSSTGKNLPIWWYREKPREQTLTLFMSSREMTCTHFLVHC